jgi:hypothetical protein
MWRLKKFPWIAGHSDTIVLFTSVSLPGRAAWVIIGVAMDPARRLFSHRICHSLVTGRFRGKRIELHLT